MRALAAGEEGSETSTFGLLLVDFIKAVHMNCHRAAIPIFRAAWLLKAWAHDLLRGLEQRERGEAA